MAINKEHSFVSQKKEGSQLSQQQHFFELCTKHEDNVKCGEWDYVTF